MKRLIESKTFFHLIKLVGSNVTLLVKKIPGSCTNHINYIAKDISNFSGCRVIVWNVLLISHCY